MSDLERVMKHYASDQDAGHEEPWGDAPEPNEMLMSAARRYSVLVAQTAEMLERVETQKFTPLDTPFSRLKQEDVQMWGAERALYSRQLQDANKRIHELEQELLKLREQLKAFTAGQTVSVPLSAWNKLCAEAAKARPLAEEEPEAFPARALRFSV